MRMRSMKKPKLRELREAIKAVFKGPYTAKFPKEPTFVPEAYRGRPKYDKDECVGCGACKEVCPAEAISMEDIISEIPVRRLTLRLDVCIFCGQCQANCITQKGVILTNEYELSCLKRDNLKEMVEKELLLCEGCNEILGAKDHLIWLVKKLGSSSFSNPNLILAGLRKLELVPEGPASEGPASEVPLAAKRSDSFRILCPECRRKNIISTGLSDA